MILLFTSTKINYEEYSICKSTIDNMFNKVNIPMDLSSLIKDQRYKTIKTQKTWWSDNFYLQILAFPNLCLLCLSQRCPRTLWVACRSQSNHRLVISDGVPPWLVDVVFRDASTYTPVCLTGMCDLAHSCVGKKRQHSRIGRPYWEPPQEGLIKINVDGAFMEQGKAGVGVVIRDGKRTVILWVWPIIMACEEGIILAAEWSPKPVMLESDRLSAISPLSRPRGQRSHFTFFLKEMVTTDLPTVVFKHVRTL